MEEDKITTCETVGIDVPVISDETVIKIAEDFLEEYAVAFMELAK